MEQTKFTNLESEIITDRPEDCIVECLCQFYTDEKVAEHGDYNKTDRIITEVWEGVERKVYPEDEIWYSLNTTIHTLGKTKFLPNKLSEYDKVVLDDCISGSTMDRAGDVSPQYGGKVAAAARRVIDKLEKLGVKFSWAERWYR